MSERNLSRDELNALSQRVIGGAIEVHRAHGPGFRELTYRRVLEIELSSLGIGFESEYPVSLTYRDQPIGDGRIDLLIEDELIVELKAAEPNPKKYSRQVVVYSI